MNTATDRPESLKHTFTITVDVDPRWVDYLISEHTAIFSRPYYAGYWAQGMAHDSQLGWLVAECDESERWPVEDTARVEVLWRAGSDLPPRWYRLDRAAALRMWEEGVKRWGVGWYDKCDGGSEDVLLQLTLLGEVRYG